MKDSTKNMWKLIANGFVAFLGAIIGAIFGV